MEIILILPDKNSCNILWETGTFCGISELLLFFIVGQVAQLV